MNNTKAVGIVILSVLLSVTIALHILPYSQRSKSIEDAYQNMFSSFIQMTISRGKIYKLCTDKFDDDLLKGYDEPIATKLKKEITEKKGEMLQKEHDKLTDYSTALALKVSYLRGMGEINDKAMEKVIALVKSNDSLIDFTGQCNKDVIASIKPEKEAELYENGFSIEAVKQWLEK